MLGEAIRVKCALNVVDMMAHIKQMFLIPQSALGHPVSLTYVHVCCLTEDFSRAPC